MFKVFDIHTHTYPEAISEKACENLGKFYDFEVRGKGTYADLEAQAAENNVQGFLLFSVATNARQVPKVNSSIAALAELSRSHGYRTVGFAGMYQDYPDFEAEIDRVVPLGLKGVKIHPDIQAVDINDPRLLPLYEILQAREMPLYLHMGDDRPQYRYSTADKLLDVMKQFPHLSVVAAHFGGYKAFNEAVPMLAGHENIRYDTSSSLWLMTPERAVEIIGTLGAENVMFGTDYPVMNPGEELERFFRLKLTDDVREDILWNNAVRFLGLED